MSSDKKVDNKRTFTVKRDGSELKLAVKRPDNQTNQKAQLVYSRAFREAVKPPDGKPGAIVRAALEGVLREQKLWDDSKQKEFEELNKRLLEGERKLEGGNMKLSEARAIAVSMRADRVALRTLLADRNSLDVNTAEAQAENARFTFLMVACTVHADTGKPYWASESDYLEDPNTEIASESARHLGSMLYGLDDDFEKKLPENRFLLSYKFVDGDLRYIDKRGRRTDSSGRLVDADGRYIDEQGRFIDIDGNLLTEDGRYVVEWKPFFDDDGTLVLPDGQDPGFEPKIESEVKLQAQPV